MQIVHVVLCGRCKLAGFCSSECKINAWPGHKEICIVAGATPRLVYEQQTGLHKVRAVPTAVSSVLPPTVTGYTYVPGDQREAQMVHSRGARPRVVTQAATVEVKRIEDHADSEYGLFALRRFEEGEVVLVERAFVDGQALMEHAILDPVLRQEVEGLRARYQQQIKVLKIPAEEDRELVKLYDEMLEVHALSYFMMQPPAVQHRWMALHDAHHMVLPTPAPPSGRTRTHGSVQCTYAVFTS